MRSTVSKSDLAKVREFLKEMGLAPVAMEVLPGKVRMEFPEGGSLTLPDQLDEMRRKEPWGQDGRRRN